MARQTRELVSGTIPPRSVVLLGFSARTARPAGASLSITGPPSGGVHGQLRRWRLLGLICLIFAATISCRSRGVGNSATATEFDDHAQSGRHERDRRRDAGPVGLELALLGPLDPLRRADSSSSPTATNRLRALGQTPPVASSGASLDELGRDPLLASWSVQVIVSTRSSPSSPASANV